MRTKRAAGRRRRKRARTKPPWPLRSVLLLLLLLLPQLLQVIISCDCAAPSLVPAGQEAGESAALAGPARDKWQVSSGSRQARAQRTQGDAPVTKAAEASEPAELGEADELEELAERQADAPKFDPNQPALVVGSSYQNEVYLPCKILNLNEDQTVSGSWPVVAPPGRRCA